MMSGEDTGRVRAQIAELQQAMMVLGQAMYSDAAANKPDSSGRPGGNGQAKPRSEDVVDGVYHEV